MSYLCVPPYATFDHNTRHLDVSVKCSGTIKECFRETQQKRNNTFLRWILLDKAQQMLALK